MLRITYDRISAALRRLTEKLKTGAIEYYVRCILTRRACTVILVLKSIATDKCILQANIKVRNDLEAAGIEEFLEACAHFADSC